MTKKPLLRERHAHEHARVTYVELFFDLVFVFAVTQLSHAVIGHPTGLGLRTQPCCCWPSGGRGCSPPGSPTGWIRSGRRCG
ncbi:low temperature requirement protein A [Caulobacter sp. UC70_42]|uniref:low temperature requirement protein A n=1 Tax=Caulobacter sp. UC70_42 TaxID=3374551 RepID=UPI003757DF4D